MATLKEIVKNNPNIKKFIHWLIVPTDEARPRLWVSLLVNPFLHTKKSGSKIRWRTRIDVLPFNNFILGKKSVVEDFTTINNGVGDVIIGDYTLIGMGNVVIGPVNIGNNVIIAQNVVISGLNHVYQDINIPILRQPVTTKIIQIEDDCWIGANVVVTAGVTIGRHSVIAGGSVVTKDIPPFSVAGGNPAKILKYFNQTSQTWEKP